MPVIKFILCMNYSFDLSSCDESHLLFQCGQHSLALVNIRCNFNFAIAWLMIRNIVQPLDFIAELLTNLVDQRVSHFCVDVYLY